MADKLSKNEIWANKLLEPSGIKINGDNPWDIKIINPNFYNRVKAEGSLGLGESYMQAWWECESLDQLFYKLFMAKIPEKIGLSLPLIFNVISAKIFNLQAKNRAFQIGKKHYDLDNKLFSAMLGKTMAYSCGYWRNAPSTRLRAGNDLDSAQNAKFDLICRKLNLKQGQKILDIGCGWGGFLKFAAENYKVSGLGATVSKEQADFAKKLCRGLTVEIKLQDYRESHGKFDHIVSVGMFEHVGSKNYKIFFKTVKNCLKDDGLFLLHTIGLTTGYSNDPWINKYIFPNGELPFLKQIASGTEKLFIIEDLHNFGADYDKTLMAWHKNFTRNWEKLKKNYDEKFFRMWSYYLLSCAGNFRSRQTPLWQIVLSQNGIPGGYKSVR